MRQSAQKRIKNLSSNRKKLEREKFKMNKEVNQKRELSFIESLGSLISWLMSSLGSGNSGTYSPKIPKRQIN